MKLHRFCTLWLCQVKAICGTTSLTVTILALFYESLMTKGNEDQGKPQQQQQIEKKEIKPQTHQK